MSKEDAEAKIEEISERIIEEGGELTAEEEMAVEHIAEHFPEVVIGEIITLVLSGSDEFDDFLRDTYQSRGDKNGDDDGDDFMITGIGGDA